LEAIRKMVEAQLNGGTAPTASGTLQELIQSVARRQMEIPPGAKLEDDLNLSSLDRVELMSAIEDRYQVDLSDREFSQVTTIADLEELVRKSAAPATPLDYPYSPWAQRWPVTWIRIAVYYALVWTYTMIMARPKIIGRENLAGLKGPALVICNHVAQVDIGFILAALPARFRHRLAPAMQGEMLRSMRHPPKEWFFLRRWYEQLQYALVTASFNVFSLPQKAGYRESFQYAGRLADHGYNVLVFPEGLRTQTGEMAEFRKGIGLLATRLNLPVIPMRIDGMFPFKRDKKHYAPPGAIQVRIGTPVSFFPEADPEQIARELQQKVQNL
ncbi:MAG: 1-acyl-sn-glycerol-3-phosphate acyltransferase, partial [Terriglobales bacterium]